MDLYSYAKEIPLPITIVALILIAAIIILFVKNLHISQLLQSEKRRITQYRKGIEELYESDFNNPEKDFEYLNKFVRAFFKEYFGYDYSLTYLELSKEFKKINQDYYSGFCEKMSNTDYSGKKKDKEEIRLLTEMFLRILKEF